VLGTLGRNRVKGLRLAAVAADGTLGSPETVDCDLVLMSGGFTPSVHLTSQARGRLRWDAAAHAFLPDKPAERERSAGACRGVTSLAEVLADGARAGAAAAAEAAGRQAQPPVFTVEADDWSAGGVLASVAVGRSGAKAFVDWQHDVTARDLELAAREGFRSIEHIKRYTTAGMATDQGKTSNLNALGYVSSLLGQPVQDFGLTTFRPPFTPVTFGSLAGLARGALFDPVRTTPIHGWAVAQGAVFEDVGPWRRARFFPRAGEDMHAAVLRESAAVRSACGVFDGSTLGKIEVVGADAAEFLNRLYVNSWKGLKAGRCRYGVLLGEDGFIRDDGVVGRLADDHFHVTTTTGGAARVLHMMEDYLKTEWPDLDVWLTSITEQWTVIALQGPRARDILAPLTDIDLSPEAFPHMSVAEASVAGAPARLFRVSFTGEVGFEVNVPASRGREIWEAIWAAGQLHGLTPYGTEAMHVLRAEKGYIIVGQETDGTTTPGDAGLGWAIGKAKPDFVGKRSLERPAMSDPARPQLVGLLTVDPGLVLEEGAQLVDDPAARGPGRSLGHVTSAYASPALGRSIALAMVTGGAARHGETLHVLTTAGSDLVTVVPPVLYDAEGARLNG
jgi:sarcosine oxidase subunit alpha